MRSVMLFLCCLLAVSAVPGQEVGSGSPDPEQSVDPPVSIDSFIPEIVTRSGTPLLLEISIPDAQGSLTAVTVQAPTSEAFFQIAPDPARESVDLTLSPFLTPGVYDLIIRMEASFSGETQVVETPVQVGFVDFVFGSDNLKFGNNADYESVIGTYGEILEGWIEERFGAIPETELVPVVDYMYQFFGNRSGRCYAFAGSELRYWRWPDLLPSYYDETYDLHAGVSRTQREMNYLQLDMAFDHFLTGQYDLAGAIAEDADRAMREVILQEAWAAVSRIQAGEPVVVGFIGPKLHHAMLVYGYIHRPDAGTLDLLVANNWKSEQDMNLRSSNAEAVRVFLEPRAEAEDSMFEWSYIGGIRNRGIDRLFIVEVKREYSHDRSLLENVISTRMGLLTQHRRAVVVVEEAAGAWLTNGEGTTGYVRRRNLEEIDGVLFDKLNRAYRFEYPADADLWLELDDDAGARVLHFHPGGGQTEPTAWIGETEEPEDGATVRRRLSLDTGEVLPAVVADAED